MDANNISEGKILDTSGDVVFKVKFSALVFKPYRGEILDGVVSDVNSEGIFIECGPLRSYISKAVRNGLIWIEVGDPLQVRCEFELVLGEGPDHEQNKGGHGDQVQVRPN